MLKSCDERVARCGSSRRHRYRCLQLADRLLHGFGVCAYVWVRAVCRPQDLAAPDQFEPTFQCCTSDCVARWPDDCPTLPEAYGPRPWLVNLFDLNGKSYIPFLAAPISILSFILCFLDNGITWHLINRPENKLTHGAACNYDTVVIALMLMCNSVLGLPWLIAATVRSSEPSGCHLIAALLLVIDMCSFSACGAHRPIVNHVQAMSEKHPTSGKIVDTQETRLTNLLIHLLCLASIFALPLLRNIPVPVLYGACARP